ncbi:von Willebrand factor type A domain-containing protein [Cercophora samala]|uniref:von Willebrand factor type A domain-containing protein n=1 Tax=Cercophora samala TaxID=330535 RepID=A0AA40D890_9PEZI|nr:von Willebrand factor type A domain-containing protein [Cercophora samala]
MHLAFPRLASLTAILALTGQVSAAVTIPPPQKNSTCEPLFGKIEATNGGRKIGVVIDRSGSMEDTDPSNLRLQAAKLLVGKLITSSGITTGQTADQVTIVQFNETAEVLYPLGDPSSAGSSIDGIPANGGTFIGGGISAALDELTRAGNKPDNAGIFVLTDGADDPPSLISDTIDSINRAQQAGIRVSFGFLSVDAEEQDSRITSAILQSGGTFTTVNTAEDTSKLVAQALLNGLVGAPQTGSVPLLPGLKTAGMLSQTSLTTFSYAAQTNEAFNVTVTAIDNISLKATLKESGKSTEIKSTVTDDTTGVAVLEYTALSGGNYTIEVSSAGGSKSSGLFAVQIGSSLDPCKPSNSTQPHPSGTGVVPSPTTSTVFTAGAVPVGETALQMGVGLSLMAAVFEMF